MISQHFRQSGKQWLIARVMMRLCPMWSFFISYLLYQYCGAEFLAGNMLGIPECLSGVDTWKFPAMLMPLPLADGSLQPWDWIADIQMLRNSFYSPKWSNLFCDAIFCNRNVVKYILVSNTFPSRVRLKWNPSRFPVRKTTWAPALISLPLGSSAAANALMLTST